MDLNWMNEFGISLNSLAEAGFWISMLGLLILVCVRKTDSNLNFIVCCLIAFENFRLMDFGALTTFNIIFGIFMIVMLPYLGYSRIRAWLRVRKYRKLKLKLTEDIEITQQNNWEISQEIKELAEIDRMIKTLKRETANYGQNMNEFETKLQRIEEKLENLR